MTHQHERTIATWCAILCLVAIFLSQLIVPHEAHQCPPCVTRVETSFPNARVALFICDGEAWTPTAGWEATEWEP